MTQSHDTSEHSRTTVLAPNQQHFVEDNDCSATAHDRAEENSIIVHEDQVRSHPPSTAANGLVVPKTKEQTRFKRYKCLVPRCTAKPFRSKSLLDSHKVVHSDARPYSCPIRGCLQSFNRKNEMRRWVNLQHTTACDLL